MKARLFGIIIALLLAGCSSMPTQKSTATSPPTKLGVEVLFEKHADLIRGKHVGLITNPTGVDSHLDSIIERFRAEPGVTLVALYGPEHGVRGNAQAGEYVPFYYDDHFKLPVFSLYGQTHKPPADMMTNIDEYMRSFDTKHEGKQVASSMMQSVDVMIFDLQDVGTRVYTYIATMAYAMQAAAESGEDPYHIVQVDPDPRAYRLHPLQYRATERDPGGDQPVHRDIEGEHVCPLGLRPDQQRRPARSSGVRGQLLTHQAGRGQLRGQPHDRAAVQAHPLGQLGPGGRATQVYVPEQGAEVAPADVVLATPDLWHGLGSQHYAP